ncbi:hypothetical protein [Spirosoma arcticum]
MKKLSSTPAFSLLPMLAIALLMVCSHQLTAQTIPTKKTIPGIQKIDWREGANRKNVTFTEVQAQFKKDWVGKKSKKGEGYKVFKRWENYMAPRVYPSGNMALPSSTYANYMAWQKQTASQQQKGRVAASTANFTELNPNAKASGYDSGVGRIDFVRFDPSNPNILYVCSPDGGLWKSTNGGTTWTTNTDFLPIIGCSDLVINPTNTQTMYLATGNRENDRASIGILKSTNGGTTWNTTALVFPAAQNYRIRRLIMDPTNPQIMIAVTDGGPYRTTDGWATFTQPDIPGDFNLDDIEFKPGDPNTVYTVGKEFFKSTDKGVSWTKIASGLPAASDVSRALIAVTAANPNYIYALYGNTDGGYLGTFRSTNSGTSFTQRSSPTSPAGTNNILNCDITTTSSSAQAGHNLAIVASPTNAEVVTIGGCNVLQSTNGGTTWTLSSYWLGLDANNPGIGQGPADYVHADIQSLDYLPGSSTALFVTCDGGISKSTNNGRNWTDISHNLQVAQMTNVGQSSLTPYNMITGLQDIGTLKNTNGAWSVTNGGDGEDGFIDRTNDNNIITSNPNGAFALSNDGGVNRSDITGLPAGTEFFSPIHQDPVNAATVYAGGRARLYRSTSVLTNPDAAWTALGTPAGEGGIQRFEIAPSNNRVIYVLKGGNTISKSTNGGTSFANITGTLPIGDAQVTNLCVSNTDANKVWVTFSGYNAAAKVYKSVNGGATWTNISAGLPNIPMNTIVYLNNSASDAVYVGADIGVYYFDNTTPWTSFFTGLPNTHVNDLEIYYPTGKIRAATYGRGLWESNLFDRSIPVVSLTAPDSVASEPPHSSGGGRLGATTSAAPARIVRRSANARMPADEPVVDHATFRFERDNADEKLPIEFEISGTAIHNVDHFFDDTTHFEVGEFAFDLLVYPGHDIHPEDHETLTLTLLDPNHYDVHHTDDAATITIMDNDGPAQPFSITGVSTVSCTTISAGQRQISFTPQYAGVNGQPITFRVVNELSPTTAPGPYTLNPFTDNPTLTLKAVQSGTAGEVTFGYNWLAACTNSGAQPPTSPFSITGVNTVSCTTLSAGQRQISFTPQYAGVNGQPITFRVVNELSPTTAPGPYTLNPFTDNPTLTLKAVQSGTAGEVTFGYNWLAACTGSVTPPPAAPFAITRVSTVSCTTLSAGQRQISFTPQYGGLNGQPITFQVVNELSPTTAPGPYTLRPYTDNPTLTLKAVQSGTADEVSFVYNWLAACTNSGARIGAEPVAPLQVRVLGNPAQNGQVSVEVMGAAGQSLRINLTDLRGQTIDSYQVERAGWVEQHTFEMSRRPVGQLLLRVTTPTQSQAVKVIKAD